MVPPSPGHFIQLPRESSIGGRRRLAGGGPQPAEDMAEVGGDYANIDQGGGGCPDLKPDIIGCGAVGPVVRVRDGGDDIVNWEDVRRIPSQGGLQADREATSEREGRILDIPPSGGRDGGSGTAGGGDLILPPLEHGCTVHCNQAHCVPLSGSVAETGYKDTQSVVVTGQGGCGRDADRGLGVGMYGGGEETDRTETDMD